MILHQRSVAAITLGLFVAGIGLTMAFNLWTTTTTKNPARYDRGQATGLANPADIRGSYTLADVAAAFPIEVDTLARAFRVPLDGNQAGFQAKNLEAMAEGEAESPVGTDAVRLFTALWVGRPFVPEETTRLFPEALEELKQKLAPADWDRANAYRLGNDPAVKPEPVAKSSVDEQPQPSSEVTSSDKLIKGNTTFGELQMWGVSAESIREVLGGIGAGHESIRNWSQEQGLEFSSAKAKLQALVTP